MAEVSNNIIRYAGETHPSKSTLQLQGIPLAVNNGWRIEIRYKVPKGTQKPGYPEGELTDVSGTELVIDGVITDDSLGKFNIYPHARLRTDTNLLTPGKYVTSELRAKLISNNGGDDTDVPYVNQVWDDNEVGDGKEYPFYIVRLKEFDSPDCSVCYLEEQVHNVGLIQLASRWLK